MKADELFLKKLQELNDKGYNYRGMSEFLGVTYYNLLKRKQNAEKKTGIKINYTNAGRRAKATEEERKIAKELRSQGKTLAQIGKKLNRSTSFIYQIIQTKRPKTTIKTTANWRVCVKDGCKNIIPPQNHRFCDSCRRENAKVSEDSPDFYHAGGIEGNRVKRTGTYGSAQSRTAPRGF